LNFVQVNLDNSQNNVGSTELGSKKFWWLHGVISMWGSANIFPDAHTCS